MDAMPVPYISDELIAYLDSVYPDRCSDPRSPDALADWGRVSVVRFLKHQKAIQEEEMTDVSIET